jgi:2,4-dienoyl-CoA reductase (NADPH2)
MEFVRLFEPIQIGGMTVPNRIAMPAMALFFTYDYSLTGRFKAFYRERARGGTGLMIMGPVAIDRAGSNPFMLGLFDDRFIGPMKEFVEELHEQTEAKIGVQLMHTGRYASSRITGVVPMAPSPLASPINTEVPREMTKHDIVEVKDAFLQAALRAKSAGFDYVELMAAGGYLIGEFLSPATNRRTDEYGGSPENRMRLALEVISRIKSEVGGDFVLAMRVSGQDYMAGGNTIDDAVRFCREAEKTGIECINVTGGWHETRVPQITSDVPPGTFVHLARSVKENVIVPVFASNRLGDPEVAEGVLRSDGADMVCWGRPLIADPYLPQKAKEGRLREIVPCIGCNQGCLDSIFFDLPVYCILNPQAGREEHTEVRRRVAKKRTIYVAGGGPGGLQFAATASQRGHKVTLFEKAEKLGGQINLVGVVPGKEEFLGAVRSLENRARAAGVRILTGKKLTSRLIQDHRPDLLVVASGVKPGEIDVPGVCGPNVVSARDILNGTVSHIGRRVLVVGAGAIGCEPALYIAHLATLDERAFVFLTYHKADDPDRLRELLYRSGREITMVDIAGRAAANVGPSTRWALLKRLRLMGVQLRLNAAIVHIEDGTALVEGSAGMESVQADMVVIATGSRPLDELSREAVDSGIETIVIGDAKEPRKIGDAVREGFDAALEA